MILRVVSALVAVVLMAGCAGEFSPTVRGSSQETFRAREKGVTAGWGREGVVILPVQVFSPELREAPKAIFEAISSDRRDVRVSLAAEESARDIGPEGMAALSKDSGARYVLTSGVKSSTRDRFTVVDISARLIDSRSGDTVWEGTGQARGSHTVTSLLGYHNISVNKKTLLQEAARQLAAILPR